LGHMAGLAERLSRWDVYPEKTVTHRFTLEQAPEAYRVMDGGQCGKVVIVFPE
jgi:threonine dehydrogenase-like Zn-dependent dehydrogenase